MTIDSLIETFQFREIRYHIGLIHQSELNNVCRYDGVDSPTLACRSFVLQIGLINVFKLMHMVICNMITSSECKYGCNGGRFIMWTRSCEPQIYHHGKNINKNINDVVANNFKKQKSRKRFWSSELRSEGRGPPRTPQNLVLRRRRSPEPGSEGAGRFHNLFLWFLVVAKL